MTTEPKLTRGQAAIIGAFTGIACGPFSDLHGYIDSLPGFKGIPTHSLGDPKIWDQIKGACRADFLAITISPEDAAREA